MTITIQYFRGCPHWTVAAERVQRVLEDLGRTDAKVEFQVVDGPETAVQVRFRGSPTILIDGRDPFGIGEEPVGLSCRVYETESGPQGSPTESQLRRAFGSVV